MGWRSGGFSSLKKSRSAGAIAKQEHPSIEETARQYPLLSRKHRENKAFLPMASRRSESVSTLEKSDECQRIRRQKWQLKAVAKGIQNATAVVLEPLDEERLKQEALAGLKDKAMERMRFEGVSQQQQNAVLAEMFSVLEEQAQVKTTSVRQAKEASDMQLSAQEVVSSGDKGVGEA